MRQLLFYSCGALLFRAFPWSSGSITNPAKNSCIPAKDFDQLGPLPNPNRAFFVNMKDLAKDTVQRLFEPRHEKSCLQGF